MSAVRPLSMRTAIWLLVIGLLAPTMGWADTGSTFGLNPRSMGLGGAYSGVADDVTALYFNPAGLVQLKGMTLATGLMYGTPRLSESDRNLGMPDERSYYLHAGLPLSGRVKDFLALAVSLNLPWGKLLGAKLYKKQEPYFALYDSSIHMLQFRAGAGMRIPWQPLSFLSFGATMQMFGSVDGRLGFYSPFQPGGAQGADDADSRLEAWGDFDVPSSTFFTVGAMAEIGDNWRVGVTYHEKQSITVRFPISFTTRLAITDTLRPAIPVDAIAKVTSKYQPQMVNVGGSYRWGRWLFAGELAWIDYSTYEIPYGVVEIDLDKLRRDPDLALLLGPSSQLLDPLVPKMDWQDVVVPRGGAEVQALSWLFVRGGYYFEPSPLKGTDFPIFDCDKHGFSLSARASFLKPWGLVPGWLHLDLAVQDIWYVGREILGSQVGGHVLSVSTGIEVTFI